MIQSQVNLKPFTTFGVDAFTTYFSSFQSIEELKSLLIQNRDKALLILGGGSNVLFTQSFMGLTLKNEMTGIKLLSESDSEVLLKVGAGEVWHEFVLYCVNNGFAGVENLSLIPGSVGASPMQNIGAYGVEVKDVIQSVSALHIDSLELHTFTNRECEFGYRESVFKRAKKGQYVITDVTFKLNKHPNINTSYGAIDAQLKEMGITDPTIKDVSNAVIAIRQSKLPNPAEIGNAGSFFKNPVVTKKHYQDLQIDYPSIPSYPIDELHVKVPAGWLIEQAGWKGKTFDTYGVHKLQALVLVNYGGATGQQIWDLSSEIVASIKQKFGISLEREVNII